MAASMQGFIQTMVMTFTSAVLAPLLGASGIHLAFGLFSLALAGYLSWFIYARHFLTAPKEQEDTIQPRSPKRRRQE